MNSVQEMIDVLLAYQEGKTIQVINLEDSSDDWKDCFVGETDFDFSNFHYRIKPTYIPFGCINEVFAAIKEHGYCLVRNDTRTQIRIVLEQVQKINQHAVCIGNSEYSYEEAFDRYKFLDDTPFGKMY